MGWGWGALRQRREPGSEEGTGGLPCGTRGAAAPWPGVAHPGGGLEPGRAGQPREAALVARVVRGCAAGRAGRRGGGAGGTGPAPGAGPGAGRGRGRGLAAEAACRGARRPERGRPRADTNSGEGPVAEWGPLGLAMGHRPDDLAFLPGDPCWVRAPTTPMDHPVPLVRTLLLFFHPTLPDTPLPLPHRPPNPAPHPRPLPPPLTGALPSSQTILPRSLCTRALCPLTGHFLHWGWGTRPGSQPAGVRRCSLSHSGRLELRAPGQDRPQAGTSGLTSGSLLPSPATCWETRFPRSSCFVHLLPSGGPAGQHGVMGAARRGWRWEGWRRRRGWQEKAAHSPTHLLIPSGQVVGFPLSLLLDLITSHSS